MESTNYFLALYLRHSLDAQLTRLTLVVEFYRVQTEQDIGRSPVACHSHDDKSDYNDARKQEPAKEKLRALNANSEHGCKIFVWQLVSQNSYGSNLSPRLDCNSRMYLTVK